MSVEGSWLRVLEWLTVHAPATAAGIRPPADVESTRAAESTFPQRWPDDLREWYRLHDGAKLSRLFTGVLPGYCDLLSLKRAVAASRAYVEQSARHSADYEDVEFLDGVSDAEQARAGEVSLRFLRSWVPIAQDRTGCTMFVDCRHGVLYGCVTAYEREEGDTDGPVWDSIGGMLSDLAQGLEQGRSCGGWQPQVNQGVLVWEPADN